MQKWISTLFGDRRVDAATSVTNKVSQQPAAAVDCCVDHSSVESLESRQLLSATLGLSLNNVTSSTYATTVNLLHQTGTKSVHFYLSVDSYSDHSENGLFKYIRDFHNDGFSTLVTVTPKDGLRASYSTVNSYFSWLAGDLGGAVDIWEVGNEPDLNGWNMPDYVNQLLDPASAALHAHGEKVCSGGVSWNPADIQSMVDNGMLNDVDYVGYHPYRPTLAGVESCVAEIKSMIGNKPLIATEWNTRGFSSSDTGAWADAIANYWPVIKNDFAAEYYYASYKVNTPAGPAGLLTSSGSPNEPFYSTFKSLSTGSSSGSLPAPAPTPTPTPTPVSTPAPTPVTTTPAPTGNLPSATGAPVVAGFKIIDAITGLVIPGYSDVTASTTVSLSKLAHKQIEIEALTTSVTSSVKFQFSGRKTFVANNSPFGGFVSQTTGAATSWYATAGSYNLIATGYTADNAAGVAGNSLGITIKFA